MYERKINGGEKNLKLGTINVTDRYFHLRVIFSPTVGW